MKNKNPAKLSVRDTVFVPYVHYELSRPDWRLGVISGAPSKRFNSYTIIFDDSIYAFYNHYDIMPINIVSVVDAMVLV